jgi:RHS repeat-associated protein
MVLATMCAYATTPQVTGTSPVSGPVGTIVQINGSGFGASQGSSAVNFNATYPATIKTWSDTQITAVVPPQAFTGQVVVVVGGVSSNQSVYFNVPAPQITSVSPASGVVGTPVTINGSGFQFPKPSNATVMIGGFAATTSTWNDTQIVATVPPNATTGAVTVTVNSVVSNQDQIFTLPNPVVSALSPSTAAVQTSVQISGSGFGASTGTVQFNGTTATTTTWNDSNITATVPLTATSGAVVVTVGGVSSKNSPNFIVPAPQITGISPSSGPSNTLITINGSGFQATQGSSAVQINGSNATVRTWSDTQITATPISGTTSGPVRVRVNNVFSNQEFTFTFPSPIITSISPSTGPVETQVTVNGTGFGASQGTINFDGWPATTIISWSDTQIVAAVPDTAMTGAVTVTTSNVTTPANIYFTVASPQITSISPSTGPPGTPITIYGSGFRPQRSAGGNSFTLAFNGVSATSIQSWGPNQISATVPAAATTGSVKISGFGDTSNVDVVFTTANPVVSSLSPSSGPVGTTIQINGSGFGTTPGTVSFNGANVVNPIWGDTQITATVPTTAKSGSVTVTVAGVTSNGNIDFTVPAPQITSISPSSGPAPTAVTINGSGFQNKQNSSTLTFANGNSLTVNTWSDTQIQATIPAGSGSAVNPVKVNVNGVSSNSDVTFTLPSPVLSSISPTGGPTGSTVQINGSGFGATQGTVSFNFVNATVNTWTDNLITATVPATSTTGAVRVTAGGVSTSSNPTFFVSNLYVNTVSPAAGSVGATVTVTGSGFGSSGSISFNNVAATNIPTWTNTQIVATIPTGTTTGPVKVTVGGISSSSNPTFTVAPAVVSSVSPTSGLKNTAFQINGSGFGATQGTSTVSVNGWTAAINTWSDTLISANVPSFATSGQVWVTVNGVASNMNVNFTVSSPVITSISPSSGAAGTQIQLAGHGFGGTLGTVTINGVPVTNLTWTDTSISGTVAQGTTTGSVIATELGNPSNSNLTFTVPPPTITSISPSSGVVGTPVTINGTGFQSLPSSLRFNNTLATNPVWTDTQIQVTVPSGAQTGPVAITLGGITSNQDVIFTMPNPVVTSLSPTTGPANGTVQITGSGFTAPPGSSTTVSFNGVQATATVNSDTSISATVPSTAKTGAVKVTVGGVASASNIDFVIPPPHITSITPNTGTANSTITVTGTGFHDSQGSGSLTLTGFNANATVVTWHDTQIVATVPSTAISGGITVTQNVASNSDVEFTMISPLITGLVPASGPVGTQLQINGSGFGSSPTNNIVAVSGTNANVVTWSDTKIVITVPPTALSGPVSVTVAGVTSNNNYNFTVPPPQITSLAPSSGGVGTSLAINGTGFQSSQGTGKVCFSSNTACTSNVISWSDTQIVVAVPSGATSGPVQVSSSSTTSNQNFNFNMPNPVVASLTPASGPGGAQVQINGSGFGATQGSSAVQFNGTTASVVSWSDTQVVATAPLTAVTGPVSVIEGGVNSNRSVDFNVPTPTITGFSPAIGGSGNLVTITGTGFQSNQGSNSWVTFSGGNASATIKSWSDTQIVAVVPQQTTTGFLSVTVNSTPSNYVNYVIPNQTISTITPTTGPVGTQVTLTGTGFGSSQGTSVLSFSGQPAASISSWSNTQIIGTVPVTAVTGPAVVTVGGVNSSTILYTVPAPNLGSFSPFGGVPGTQVTLTGLGFQANQRDSTVTFNGSPAAVKSWSDSQIVVTVPAGASTGSLLVTVNGVSNPNNGFNNFEVPNPVIAAITPSEAPPNGTITITGSGFGSNAVIGEGPCWGLGTCSVQLNGVNINFTSWSDTMIIAQIPASGAASGTLQVLKYDTISNAAPITIEGLPTVAGLSPIAGPVGGSVVVSGSGFGPTQGNSTIDFSGAVATVTDWSDAQITAVVPPGSETGPVTVTVAGISGDTQDFTIDGSVQVTDSLGHVTNYVTTMVGGAWYPTLSMGSGCSTCSVRGVLNTQYDNAGHALSSTDELQHQSGFTYDANGNLASSTVYLDANTPVTTSYTYNSFGEPLTVTDPLGNVTTNTYDTNGNLLTVTSPAPNGTTAASVTQFAYDTKGELTQITDPLSHITTLAYYPTGLIHTITDAQSNITSYEYDQRGNRTAVVDAQQNRTTFAYDAGNRLTSITYPDSTAVSFGYDTRGRRTSVTDQNGKITSYAYDDADRLTSVTDAALNVTSYAYDTENNLLSITDANNHTTSFAYDAFGRVTQTTFPSTLVESYVYDALGNLTSKTDRKNQTINYVYDALNRLTHKGYPDQTGVDYVYDLVGKIKQVTDPTGSYGFAYDNMGRLVGTSTQYAFLPGQTYTNAYTYDAASNRTGFTAPDGSTNTYAYDTLGRLSSLSNSLTGQFGFGYDNLSRRTQLTRPNGVNTNYSYDSLSRLQSVLHQAGTNTIDGASYLYDNAGNRTSKTNYLNNITENYTYDPLYQLTQVTQGATTTESYSYDPVGNRLSSLGMPSYAHNSSNELTSTSAATFTYDNNGNTLTKTDSNGTTTYNWDLENRLTSVALPGTGGTVVFKYGPLGSRIQKSSSTVTTNYLYDGSDTVAELDQTGAIVARFTQGVGVDEPLATQRGGATFYYDQDGLGSATTLTGSSGTMGNSYIYDAFGNITASTGNTGNPYTYTARDLDSETGLLYYRGRYYDPTVGRFITEDPAGLGGGINFYAYVGNDPANLTDPFGLCPPDKCKDKEAKLAEMERRIYAERGSKQTDFKGLAQRFKQYLGSKAGEGYADSDHINEIYKAQGKLIELIKDYIDSGCGDPPHDVIDWAVKPLPVLAPKPKTNPNSNPLVDWYWKHYPFTGPFWDGVRDWQNDVERNFVRAFQQRPSSGWETPPPSYNVPWWEW